MRSRKKYIVTALSVVIFALWPLTEVLADSDAAAQQATEQRTETYQDPGALLLRNAEPNTFVSIVTYSSGSDTSTGYSSSVALPDNLVNGNLLVVILGTDGDQDAASVTFPAGWTTVQTSNGTANTVAISYKTISDDSSPITVEWSESEVASWLVYQIEDWDSIEISTGATGASATPDPPNFEPTGGSDDILWLAVAGWDDKETCDEYPHSDEVSIGESVTDENNAHNVHDSTKVSKNAATATGYVAVFSAYMHLANAGNVVSIGSFSAVGDTLTCHDAEEIGEVSLELNTFTGLDMDIDSGEYLGISAIVGYSVQVDTAVTGGSGIWFASGEHCVVDDQTEYGFTSAHAPSFLGTIFYGTLFRDGANSICDTNGGCGVGVAFRESAVSSENPPTFTISGSEQWVTYTIAIYGAEGEEPSISSTPSSYSFGTVGASGTSNSTLTHFNVTNDGSNNASISIQGTDLTNATAGSTNWTLSDTATPGENIYGLKVGVEGGDFTIIVKKTATFNDLVADLPPGLSQRWGLKLYAPTSLSNGDPKTGTVTLTASAA